MLRARYLLLALLGTGCATSTTSSDRAPATANAEQQPPPVQSAPAEAAVAAPEPAAATAPEVKPASATVDAPTPAAAPAPALPEVADLDAQAHLDAGVDALKVKNAPLAIAHLQACARKAKQDVRCHWELGWAHYLEGNWEQVVAAWSEVKRLDPSHAEVDGRLVDANNQLALRKKLEAMEQDAPQNVRPEPPQGATVRLRAVGDVMLGTAFPEGYLPPEDGAQMLAGVKDWLLDADVTFVNLEGPLCDTEKKSDKCRKGGNCYAFRTPTSYVKYLVDAGVDLASTANNHSGDFGEECRRQTEAVLDKVGIKWSGAPGTIATIESNGLRIAMVAFHTSPAVNDVNDQRTAEALVRAASKNHDLVVVSFHGGAEGAKAIHVPEGRETFYGENRGDLRKFSRGVVDAGADVVIGHGPHVLRGMEIYNDRLIAYSLGNFATYGRFNLSGPLGVGAILEVVLDATGRFVSGRVLPTRQIGEGVPVKDEEKATAVKYVRMLSGEDFPTTGVVIDAEGNIGKRPSQTARDVP